MISLIPYKIYERDALALRMVMLHVLTSHISVLDENERESRNHLWNLPVCKRKLHYILLNLSKLYELHKDRIKLS